jgi:hypothetical protein
MMRGCRCACIVLCCRAPPEHFFGLTKISGFDPHLPTIWTAYATHQSRRSFTHQSSWPAFDHVAICTWIGGSTARRSAVGKLLHLVVAEIHT